MGKTNITYDSLYKLSLSDLNKIAEGKNSEMREHWEMSRDISFWVVKGWTSKKNIKRSDLRSFPWDKKRELTKEKINMIKANADKLRELIENGKIKYDA